MTFDAHSFVSVVTLFVKFEETDASDPVMSSDFKNSDVLCTLDFNHFNALSSINLYAIISSQTKKTKHFESIINVTLDNLLLLLLDVKITNFIRNIFELI